MADFDAEMELLRAAIRATELLQDVVKAVESKLAPGAKDVRDLIRPCMILAQRVIEAQASLEALIEKLHSVELCEASSAMG